MKIFILAFNLIYIIHNHFLVNTFQINRKVDSNRRLKSLCAIKQHLILFNPFNLRFHDNPCLNYAEKSSLADQMIDDHQYSLLLINDPKLNIKASFVHALEKRVNSIGGKLHIKDLSLLDGFDEFHGEMVTHNSIQGDDEIEVITTDVFIEPYKSWYKEFHQYLSSSKKAKIKLTILRDTLLRTEQQVRTDNYLDHASMYQTKNIPLPNMSKYEKIRFNEKSNFQQKDPKELAKDSISVSATTHMTPSQLLQPELMEDGEEFALFLVKDFISLGDDLFTKKYQDQYVNTIAKSIEHKKSFERLRSKTNSTSASQITSNYGSFFQGEVLSGLLTPLISQGLISPRLLMHSRKVLFPGWKGFLAMERPLTCRIRNEIIRKDWQTQIACKPQIQQLSSQSSNSPHWNISFSSWRGYIQREATMIVHTAEETKTKPMLLLVHGFGGSINQYTGLAQILSEHFDIFAIDSLGFGQSEKPPVSYNQYLWRDQIQEFIERKISERESLNESKSLFIAGNSIGGYFASSLSAALSSYVSGLILFNPSGDVVGLDDTSSATSTGLKIDDTATSSAAGLQLQPQYPEYQGPSSELLRLFGRLVFSLLQPRITTTCEWLYPSNKDHVTRSGLASNIYRDSCDPGASDVIASGGKLPEPLTINDFFRVYKGPVLLAQGALDPLNNATLRANAFGKIRDDVTVDLLPLGHCPMDENPTMVATSILTWGKEQKIL